MDQLGRRQCPAGVWHHEEEGFQLDLRAQPIMCAWTREFRRPRTPMSHMHARARGAMRLSTNHSTRARPDGEISIAGRRAGATFIGAAGLPAAARAGGWRRRASRGARAQCPHSVQTPVASAA